MPAILPLPRPGVTQHEHKAAKTGARVPCSRSTGNQTRKLTAFSRYKQQGWPISARLTGRLGRALRPGWKRIVRDAPVI